jgi:hypothetical protein
VAGNTECADENIATGESTTVTDPDTHHWLYFKTATGEQVTLDRRPSRTPNSHCQDYDLVEEQRFSVMHDPDLHDVLQSGQSPGVPLMKDAEKIILFLEMVNGGTIALDQEGKMWWYRTRLSSILNHLLSWKH